MCLICVDYQKGTLTLDEAWRNLYEMKDTMESDHLDVVMSMLSFGDNFSDILDPEQVVIDYGQMIEEEDE